MAAGKDKNEIKGRYTVCEYLGPLIASWEERILTCVILRGETLISLSFHSAGQESQ